MVLIRHGGAAVFGRGSPVGGFRAIGNRARHSSTLGERVALTKLPPKPEEEFVGRASRNDVRWPAGNDRRVVADPGLAVQKVAARFEIVARSQ